MRGEKTWTWTWPREIAKAVKEFSRLSKQPEGFTDHPGDAIAYQVWKSARQKADLQERSRLIAKGLRFAHSDSARKQIEQLLMDFTVVPATPAPRQPVYRQDSDEDLPRVLPVVGKLPLAAADLKAVPMIEETEPFGMVQFSGTGVWVSGSWLAGDSHRRRSSGFPGRQPQPTHSVGRVKRGSAGGGRSRATAMAGRSLLHCGAGRSTANSVVCGGPRSSAAGTGGADYAT